ncbi:AAA family ATPase [Glycomyces sp. A-F 0318]|uniref:ATP-binding protein n=1 Tax=Glycomyces amatae TaxID=2881355 RepID=UPI001E592A0B|nr:AAA family ATPase [Glycomyces amatae]
MTDSLLIGRDHPAAVLRSAVERTIASHGGLVLITGEAGIGKTALVTDVAAAYRGDLAMAFATSWESEAVPEHWLWTQILRSLRARLGEDQWRALRPAPAVDALLGEGEGAPPVEFELHDAVTQLLIAASQCGPLLVVLDDLHFADPGSIELLKFACQHTFFERLLFVGTYRDSEIDPGHRLRARMLPLVAKAAMIGLDGLDEPGVAALVRTTVGDAPDADTVAEIARRTGGNPFFVEQTARLWASGQPVDATTAGMRDALQRRIEQLPPPLLRMLTLASVGGREFHAAVMAQAAGRDPHEIEAALDAACQTGLVRRGRDRYVFVHDLVRETLYNTMPEAEAAHHHGCVVRALAADESLQKLMLSTEIAHHAWLAGDDLDAATAVRFLTRAADEENACLSIAGAEKHYRRALERCAPGMARQRVLLRLELAGVLKWRSDEQEARRLREQALIEAEASGDPMLLARVAVEELQDERSEEISRAKALAYTGLTGHEPDPGLDPAELTRRLLFEYLVAARRAGSDEDVAFGLWANHAVNWGPGSAHERLSLVDELTEVTRRSGDHDTHLYAESLRWVALLELGDPAYRAQLAHFCALADAAESERWRSAANIDRAVIAAVQGRFDEAAAELDKAEALIGSDSISAHMLTHLRWETVYASGAVPETEPGPPHPGHGAWHTDLLVGLTALRRGDLDQVRRVRERVDADIDLYDSWKSLLLRFQVEAAVAEGDAEEVERLRTELGPYAGQWLVALWGTSVHGPVSHWLGVLAAAAGDRDAADRHFADAAAESDRLAAAPWAALARERAAENRAAADRAARDRDDPAGPAAGPVFRRDGATWTLAYAGRTLHLPHAKGLADLHLLLSRPGVETAAADLLAGPASDGAPAVAADARLGGDDFLDAEARTRYREHLETLDERIDAAAAVGDDARAAALDAERQALIDHLKAATGLGGRSRRLGDNHERARKSVTNRIRNTLKKIEDGHPALAEHLKATVATGSACVYRPGADAPDWRL